MASVVTSPANNETSDYGHLVQEGHYSEAPNGLWGKDDNVRRYCENQITRFSLQPVLQRLIVNVRKERRGIRILDMGCGSGEGWDLLLHVPRGAGDRQMDSPHVLRQKDIALFHGVDLSPEMVDEARRRFADKPAARFEQCDLGQPEKILSQNSYDLYFSSYGSPSHLDDSQLRNLVATICRTTDKACVIFLDLLGQYSLEWPRYWGYSLRPDAPKMLPYNMVWLYPPDEQVRHRPDFSDYRVRYWGGKELEGFLRNIPEVEQRWGGLTLTDRSILCGRHLDTREFNPGSKPVRRALNGLFEFNHRTKPDELLAPDVPSCPDKEVASFFKTYCDLWNATIEAYRAAVSGKDVRAHLESILEKFDLPQLLRKGFESSLLQQEAMGWLEPGDPLSNTVQPQFGLLLRQLEFHMQKGLGCGHGLLAVIELKERR